MQSVFDEMQEKYNTLLIVHKSCAEQSNKISELSNELKKATEYSMMLNAKLQDKSKQLIDIQRSYEDIKEKYNTLINEHESCQNYTNISHAMSEELSNTKQQLKFQEAKSDDISKQFLNIKDEYEKLMNNHKSCKQQALDSLKLSEDLKTARNQLKKQEAEFQETIEHQYQLVEEIKYKYNTLTDEHKSCEEKELKTQKLLQDLQSEKSMMLIKLQELESKLNEHDAKTINNVDENKYKKLVSFNNKLTNDLKILRSKFAELKREYIKLKETKFDVECLEREINTLNTVKRDISCELQTVKEEKNKLEEEVQKAKTFLMNKSDMVEKLINFQPLKMKMKATWLPVKEDYYEIFDEKLSVLVNESEERKMRLVGMDKLVAECERLKTENTALALKIENLNQTNSEKGNQLRILDNTVREHKKQVKEMGMQIEIYNEKNDRLSKELEGAMNYASEANKKIDNLSGRIIILEKELFRANDNCDCLNNKCESLLEKLRDYQISNERLQDKILDLESVRKDNSELKLRRRSLHDSSRNIFEKIDTADKSSSTEPDSKLSELQQQMDQLMHEIANLQQEKVSITSKYQSQLHEINKINLALQSKIEIKSAEIRKMYAMFQERSNSNSVMENREQKYFNEKFVQTDSEEDCNSETFKDKYLKYRKLCQMRYNEILGLKAQLGLVKQNKENTPA